LLVFGIYEGQPYPSTGIRHHVEALQSAARSRGVECILIGVNGPEDRASEPRLISLETLSSSLALEEAHRIKRRRAPADLEVQLRGVDVAGLAGVRDYLPALDLVTTLHQ
jgi:hypothetical protein